MTLYKNNVEIYYNSTVKEIIGEEELEYITIESDNKDIKLEIDGMFISIGQIPQSSFIKDIIDLTEYNYSTKIGHLILR